MSLDKKSQLPLYAQLMKEIKDQIRKGTYKEGDQIPTEGELSAAYQVSRITVRRTIEELCSQGFLVKRQGKGTFVEIPKIYRKIENDNNMSFSFKWKKAVFTYHFLSYYGNAGMAAGFF